jgi:hypothetical protein
VNLFLFFIITCCSWCRVDPVSHVLLDLDRLLLVAGAASGVRVVDLAAASVVSEVDTEHTSVSSWVAGGGGGNVR